MDIKEYYQNLLIIQYNNKPNARATIGALYDCLVPINKETGNLLFDDIQNAFDLDTAVGVQLDILGGWIGINRLYQGQDLDSLEYFGFDDYTGFSTATLGFTDYTDYASEIDQTLTYDDLISTTNKLNDDDYRLCLKLKVAQNTIDHSTYSIDNAIYTLLPDIATFIDNMNMTITYFMSSKKWAIILAKKGLYLKPMGVGISSIQADTYFGFTDYNNSVADYTIGFSDYSNYDTIDYRILTYNNFFEV